MDLPKLRKLLAIDPNDSLSRFALGRKLAELDEPEQLEEAAGHLRFANATDPKHLATYHQLASVLMRLQLFDEARSVLTRSLPRVEAVGEGMGRDLGPILKGWLAELPPKAVKDGSTAVVRAASPEEIVDLRHRILRPGMDRSAGIFPRDTDAISIHWCAEAEGKVVCCATMFPEDYEEKPSWRLRGMATDVQWQCTGVGARVLEAAEDASQQKRQTEQLWCNARLPAIKFYERAGWSRVGQLYDIPTAGPHYVMIKRMQS